MNDEKFYDEENEIDDDEFDEDENDEVILESCKTGVVESHEMS